MDSNDAVPSETFSEEDKLTDTMDEDTTNWFIKKLGEESDNTDDHDVDQHAQLSQDKLGDELENIQDSNLITEGGSQSTEETMEPDSRSGLLVKISDTSDNLQAQKSELTELKDIDKKHDISNELKEMFEEKSSDAEELHEASLTKHTLDTDITKEDKLKDIVPDDILGKDDSFDGLDNDELHQELQAHLTYDKNEPLTDLNSESSVPNSQESENESQKETEESPEIPKLGELSFKGKTELLTNISENIGTKEIDEIMEEGMTSEESSINKDTTSDLKEISKELIGDLKDDLENKLENITGEMKDETEQKQDSTEDEHIINTVDKESIELNQENMMVEFAHGSGNQVLIQINTDKVEASAEESAIKSEGIVMETSDGQTLVFSSSEAAEPTTEESEAAAQVEGGAEFLQAVSGKLEDVLSAETSKEKAASPPPVTVTQPTVAAMPAVKKEPVKETSKCCVSSCKSGKTGLKTTYRYFKPPVNKILYKKWEYIFNQAKQELTPDSYICELHFRTGLIYKRGMDKFGKMVWALREGALPKISPTGVLRLGSGLVPPPSTTVQVPKKQESLIKTSTTPAKVVSPVAAKPVSPVSASVSPGTPKVLQKKILQKPVKTVATKVSNEVTDIGFLYKNPELVKVAQDEMANMDVLVCGECHSVFHILELFQAHKMAANCKGESNFKGNPAEPKPQVWAFLLWKSAQAKVSDVESSWKLYQRWCKMDERVRNSWIAAGKALQEGNTIASLKLTDSPPHKTNRPGRPPTKAKDSDDDDFYARRGVKRAKPGRPPASSAPVSESESTDAGGGGDFIPEPMDLESSQTEDNEVNQTLDNIARRTPELITSEVEIKQEVVSDEEQHDENKENNARKNSDEIQNCDKCKKEIENPKGGVLCAGGCYGYYHVECTRLQTLAALSKLGVRKARWKCDFCKEATVQQDTRKTPKASVATAAPKQREPEKKQGTGNNEEEEFVVEKIVSRRYNVKKKYYEYLLKWEGYPSEQNTWEPAENLGTCQHLLKAFEEALAKQQAAKQAAAARQQGGSSGRQETPYRVKPPIIPNKRPPPTSSPAVTTSTGRPQRSSKQKAMNQVKQWCGSIVKPSEDDLGGVKRKLSESDSEYDGEEEEVVVKKVKMEVESEDSDADSFKPTALGRPRGRPPLSTTPKIGVGKKVNGENLAAELGLESEDEDIPSATSPQKSPVVRKMSSLSPSKQQVLVASAKGVVTVDQKQIPNLSSGVYIMSNKSGIVKVDNNKTLNTLQKSGVLKKPFSPVKSEKTEEDSSTSPQKPTSGVVVLPRSEIGAFQQKVGVIRKTIASTPTTPTTTTSSPATPGTATPKPSGVLKSGSGLTPRPLGLLRPTTSPPVRPQGQMPNANTKVQPTLRPRMATPGRGRPPSSPLVRRPLGEGGLQATPQQKLLIAKKKAESEGGENRPAVPVSPAPRPVTALPPIRSTNKVLAHPLLSRGRGRGYRGRGRGSSLSQMLQMREREPEPEPVKESRLVDSDNLLMEFQEPSDSEESDDGLEDIFPNLEDLPPIEPDSPPRPLSLCPETGKVLCKAEGEKTPEPTPPPSPKPPTPPPAPTPPPTKDEEPTHILPDKETEVEPEVQVPTPVTVAVTASPRPAGTTTTAVVKQDGMICKVEMSPGGTTGTLVEAVSAASATPPGVTEGTVTIKKPLASRNRNLNRGPQLSVVPNTSSTSLGTITVPARKLFHEDNSDDMVTITGEDGLVYQVSNSELAGNTLLVSSGEDGEQQCVYVTTGEDGSEAGSTILTLDSAYANAVAQLGSDQVNILSTEDGDQYFIKEDDGVEGGEVMTLEGEEALVAGDDQSGQVVAQLVEAGEPAPGGSRRVVLLLPDGNLMMTEVDEEQYAALDLDK